MILFTRNCSRAFKKRVLPFRLPGFHNQSDRELELWRELELGHTVLEREKEKGPSDRELAKQRQVAGRYTIPVPSPKKCPGTGGIVLQVMVVALFVNTTMAAVLKSNKWYMSTTTWRRFCF